MLARVWIDQGNSERDVLVDLEVRPEPGAPLTIDGVLCIVDRVEDVDGREFELVVFARREDVSIGGSSS